MSDSLENTTSMSNELTSEFSVDDLVNLIAILNYLDRDSDLYITLRKSISLVERHIK